LNIAPIVPEKARLDYSNMNSESNLAYRHDIDGLRAIAVISVIVFHLWHGVLPGGYLGVDIFFVLSGYLITSIIWREIQGNCFSIKTFYIRRIRRILPALLFLVTVVTIAAAFLLLPMDLVGYARSLISTLFFVQNVYFWRDTDYFSRLAEEKPLLHLWSLGIEEQFYLIFPILLILLARRSRLTTIVVIASLVILSYISNIFALRIGALLPAFYLLPTRVWELGCGALLAIVPSKHPQSKAAVNILGLFGLASLLISLVSSNMILPSTVPVASIAVFATALIIWTGQSPLGVTRNLLSWKPISFVGLISYSLYLWHWPVFVLIKYYNIDELSGLLSGIAVVLIVIAAVFSWRYIEQPFRLPQMGTKRLMLWVAIGVMCQMIAAGAIYYTSGFPNRLDAEAAQINVATGTHYRCPVSEYLYFGGTRACSLSLPSRQVADAQLVLMGNSHAQMYAPLVRDILQTFGSKGILVPVTGCLPTATVNISSACAQVAEQNLRSVIALENVRVVVLAMTWEHGPLVRADGVLVSGSSAKALILGLNDTIAKLSAANKKVVLVGPIAVPNWDVASIVSRSLAFEKENKRQLYMTHADFNTKFAELIDHFEADKDIIFVRPDKVQCIVGKCFFILNGHSLFADSTHLAQAELYRFKDAFSLKVAPILRASQAAAISNNLEEK
jgi:peptidoglycan/LPS O-acetylase OafA/YrhL